MPGHQYTTIEDGLGELTAQDVGDVGELVRAQVMGDELPGLRLWPQARVALEAALMGEMLATLGLRPPSRFEPGPGGTVLVRWPGWPCAGGGGMMQS